MRVAEERNAVGFQIEDGDQRLDQQPRALVRQTVKHVDIDRSDAGHAQRIDDRLGHREGLFAVDRLLHLRIEVLDSNAGACHAGGDQRLHLIVHKRARIDLDRELDPVGDMEGIVQRRGESARCLRLQGSSATRRPNGCALRSRPGTALRRQSRSPPAARGDRKRQARSSASPWCGSRRTSRAIRRTGCGDRAIWRFLPAIRSANRDRRRRRCRHENAAPSESSYSAAPAAEYFSTRHRVHACLRDGDFGTTDHQIAPAFSLICIKVVRLRHVNRKRQATELAASRDFEHGTSAGLDFRRHRIRCDPVLRQGARSAVRLPHGSHRRHRADRHALAAEDHEGRRRQDHPVPGAADRLHGRCDPRRGDRHRVLGHRRLSRRALHRAATRLSAAQSRPAVDDFRAAPAARTLRRSFSLSAAMR